MHPLHRPLLCVCRYIIIDAVPLHSPCNGIKFCSIMITIALTEVLRISCGHTRWVLASPLATLSTQHLLWAYSLTHCRSAVYNPLYNTAFWLYLLHCSSTGVNVTRVFLQGLVLLRNIYGNLSDITCTTYFWYSVWNVFTLRNIHILHVTLCGIWAYSLCLSLVSEWQPRIFTGRAHVKSPPSSKTSPQTGLLMSKCPGVSVQLRGCLWSVPRYQF
jgi:hypothetical protein